MQDEWGEAALTRLAEACSEAPRLRLFRFLSRQFSTDSPVWISIARKSWTLRVISAHSGSDEATKKELLAEIGRIFVRKQVLVMLGADLHHPSTSPGAAINTMTRFVARDGDHAIAARVLLFLLE